MIIKSFTAESAAAALKQIRHSMGGDAVVLKTKQVRDARGAMLVEVTALLDKPTVAQTEQIFKSSQTEKLVNNARTLPINDRKNEISLPMNASTDCVKRILGEADFSEAYSNYLIKRVLRVEEELADSLVSLSECLIEETESFFRPNLTLNLGDKLMVVGQAGSGKTSVIGKLAAHLIIQEKKKVRFLSLDNQKIGAADEIQNYADLLGVQIIDARGDLIIGDQGVDCVTLIDTPALPYDREEQTRLIERAESMGATHTVLCLNCLTRESDLARMVETYSVFDAQLAVMTMADLSWRHGSVLSILKQSGLRLLGVTDNAGGLGRLHLPSGLELIDAMLKREVYHESSLV